MSTFRVIEELKITPDIQRENRLKLADLIENEITDEQFNMADFVSDCGTIGCALGWAVLSNKFEHLSHIKKSYNDWVDITPIVNGRSESWLAIGEGFFGKNANAEVFLNDTYMRDFMTGKSASRAVVAAALREIQD